MKSQLETIKRKLEKEGSVSNLWAIQHYCLRLGARIKELRDSGMTIIGSYQIKGGKLTKNYVYRLVK